MVLSFHSTRLGWALGTHFTVLNLLNWNAEMCVLELQYMYHFVYCVGCAAAEQSEIDVLLDALQSSSTAVRESALQVGMGGGREGEGGRVTG